MFTTDSLRVDANVFSLSSCSVIAGLASTRLELSRSKSTLKKIKKLQNWCFENLHDPFLH